ncbi:hypothetical protein HNR23_002263 [Nocardiopsis mwathae]|uniref:Uncharacterized protein n=1 Tax=Nocardiopsis mwathae TaxID=1472723 RepID=A0A7X0D5F6_9ACTN|nr:hypothetical protein [Nocardiopsis mwathae]MBB6172203.1 hypothetical protein [Nocardiopsis mwathae]
MSGVLDQLTETEYRSISDAHDAMRRACQAAHRGFAPDWGAVAAYRDAEAAFGLVCDAAGFSPEEVLSEL